MIDTYVEQLHSKMNSTFKEVICFLEQNHLRWFVCGGTAIGAIRHHNIIPWDDDIDICMPREDYNRLLELEDKLEGTNLALLKPGSKNYTQWFVKFVDLHSTILESKDMNIVYGVWVDVFPLDYAASDISLRNNEIRTYQNLFLTYQYSLIPIQWKNLVKQVLYGNLGYVRRMFISRLHSPHILLNRFLDYEKSVCRNNGDKLVSYCENGKIYESKWFEDSQWVDFADYKVRVPKLYDAYLRYVFGDYMQFPPESERVLTHHPYYVNIEEGLSLDEVKMRIKDERK